MKYKFQNLDITAWIINIEGHLYKKNFEKGINFLFSSKNKEIKEFFKKFKKFLYYFCIDEMKFSKSYKFDDGKEEFFIAFKTETDIERVFKILEKFDKKIKNRSSNLNSSSYTEKSLQNYCDKILLYKENFLVKF